MILYCKIHKSDGNSVLAACDMELIGTRLEQGEISFEVSESFYKGEEVAGEELKKFLAECGNINLVGEKVVGVALEEGLINENNIIRINKIPHVQIFKV